MIQQRIHEIWSEQLRLTDFGDDDDFFDLSGHSLIMAKIQGAIFTEYGVEVPMDELFRRSTVRDISEHLGSTLAVGSSGR
jgi:acyl carrier protein